MQVFDTHCHLGLDGNESGADPRAEHARAVSASVTDCMIVGIDAATSLAARDLARTLTGARWSTGLHPNDAMHFERDWPLLQQLAAEPDCRAIGETGLDFYRDRATPQQQERALLAQLQLARELDKPVVFHCRDAFAALIALLRAQPPGRGIMHCFSGTADEAMAAVALGLHISFAAPLTYKKNDALRQAAAVVPEDRLLVETDAPFLPPQSRRGQRNEPAFVRETLQTLANVRGWDEARAAAVTHQNAVALLGP